MAANLTTLLFAPGMFDAPHQVFRAQELGDPLFPAARLLQRIAYEDRTGPRTWRSRVGQWFAGIGRVWQQAADTDLGQEADAARLRADGAAHVAFGISRGAAATLARWSDATTEAVPRLLVLEGCPDSVHNVLRYRYGAWCGAAVEWLLERVTAYRRDGLSALRAAERFPLHIPVAFVTSARDTSVPADATLALARVLRRRGHRHVHVLVLRDAHHNNYYTASARDRAAYQAFVRGLLAVYVRV